MTNNPLTECVQVLGTLLFKVQWATMMRQAIRTADAYFNSDRMVVEYYNRLYKPIAHSADEGGISGSDYHEATRPATDAWTFSNIK